MHSIKSGWSVMRVIRLLMGIAIIVQGFYIHQWTYVAMGGLFTLMPLLNIGCCSTGACYTPQNKTSTKTEDIQYEEVHS